MGTEKALKTLPLMNSKKSGIIMSVMNNLSTSPLISAIVPVYNAEDFLNQCVKSLVNQTYKNIEIILVDDGSPDKSPALCDEWASKDSRIKVFHKKNGGVSEARNFGFARSIGEYITYIDSDDFVSQNYVNEMYSLIAKYGADIACVSHICFLDENSLFEQKTEETPEFVMGGEEACKELFTTEKCTSLAWGKLYKRRIIENFSGGFSIGRVYEDTPAVCKFLYSAEKVVCKNTPLYFHYKGNENSITHNFSQKNIDDAIWSAMERARFFTSVNAKELSDYAWNFAGGNLINILLKYSPYRKQWKHYVKEFKKESKVSLYFKLKVDFAYYLPNIFKKLKPGKLKKALG